MATVVKLAAYGVTFATRQRAAALVAEMPTNGLTLDFGGVKVASPAFVDGLIGGLSERAGRVEIMGVVPELEELVVSVIERRDLSSRFRFLAAA